MKSSLVALGALSFFACAPDSKGDFEDFEARTKTNTSQLDAASQDASSDTMTEAAPSQVAYPQAIASKKYFASCQTSILPKPEKSFRFAVTVNYAPPAGDAKGSVAFTYQPMKAGKTVYAGADEVGDPIVVPSAEVDASGAYKASVTKQMFIDGSANPISGSQVELSNLSSEGHFTKNDNFCQGFLLKMLKPLAADVTATCLYFALEEGAAIPSLTSDDFANCVK